MNLTRLTGFWRRPAVANRTPNSPALMTSAATFHEAVAATRRTPVDWWSERRRRRVFHSTIGAAAVEALRHRDPDRTARTIAAAERVLGHQFSLLGSGPYVPRDPDRPQRGGYLPIDWYLDPVRDLRFPRGVPHKQWNLLEMRPGNADIKHPWELARCQHWMTLAQARQLTGDDRFAQEIGRQLDDFVEANPTGVGVNWTCTMDVGLRAVNWAIALETVHACAALDEDFWLRAYGALPTTASSFATTSRTRTK